MGSLAFPTEMSPQLLGYGAPAVGEVNNPPLLGYGSLRYVTFSQKKVIAFLLW